MSTTYTMPITVSIGDMVESGPLLAWHFLPANGKTQYSERPVRVGQVLRVKGKLRPCGWGLHASVRAIDALKYAPGALACRVEVSTEIVHDAGDKVCARRRKVLAMADASTLLHTFACDVAEKALTDAGNPDQRSIAAIETKRRWLRGEATDAELDAARSAAWSAARSAARSAAESAARSAARSAAWSAAWSAAESAAESAAWSAAESAAESAMNDDLEARLRALLSCA